MALTDITKRIISDAQKEAQAFLSAAQAQEKSRLVQCQKELAQELTKFTEKNQQYVQKAVEQRKQLAQLGSAQAVLKVKREYLEKIKTEIKKDILTGEKLNLLWGDLFKEALTGVDSAEISVSSPQAKLVQAILDKQGLTANVQAQKDWVPGRLEINLGKSRVNGSIDLFLTEALKNLESDLAQVLFEEA